MQKSPIKKMLLRLVILVLLGIASVFVKFNHSNVALPPRQLYVNQDLTDLDVFKTAFENQLSNFQVIQTGKIAKLLRDDDRYPRHQRFIVELISGQKLLIAHNIELARKVEGLKEGSEISFFGEYEWNNKGGVVHWTHHDPKGIHPNGWLTYNNRKYD